MGARKVAQMHNELVLGIKKYTRAHGFKKALLGLSGGIDSAVTAALAVKALGKNNVTAVYMPSHVSSESSKKHAEMMAKKLGIKLIHIPINSIFNSYKSTLKKNLKGKSVTEENLQARIRANILMALSNEYGYLVLATGNKSELATGYCTLYGDLAGGLAVLADIYKTEVYELAEYINIPDEIIKKEPSAELKKGQKDTDVLPPYEILDKILYYYIDEKKSVKFLQEKFGRTAKTVISMVKKAEFKRQQAPPGLRIN